MLNNPDAPSRKRIPTFLLRLMPALEEKGARGKSEISLDDLFVLVLFYTVVIFAGSYYTSLPNPAFDWFGLNGLAAHIFFLALAAYGIGKTTNSDQSAKSILAVLLFLWPWYYLAWVVIGGNPNFSYWEIIHTDNTGYLIYNLCIAATTILLLVRIVGAGWKNVIVVVLVYLVVIALPLHWLGPNEFWYVGQNDASAAVNDEALNQENTYYRQQAQIEAIRDRLLPERPGTTDMYFVGFAGDDAQDVFMKEVQFVGDLFEEKYGTAGRSALLINHRATMEDLPLATVSNLERVLNQIGRLMNPEEDFLFVYLTSHGGQEKGLSVNMERLELNPLSPAALKAALDNAGILNCVILVSACHSGGFIDTLKDENTVVFTAAAADRESFGCGAESEFTYFGKAVFHDHLQYDADFLTAFKAAIDVIEAREQNENLEPSHPQLYIGSKMQALLEGL